MTLEIVIVDKPSFTLHGEHVLSLNLMATMFNCSPQDLEEAARLGEASFKQAEPKIPSLPPPVVIPVTTFPKLINGLQRLNAKSEADGADIPFPWASNLDTT